MRGASSPFGIDARSIAFSHEHSIDGVNQLLDQGRGGIGLLVVNLIKIHPEATERLPEIGIVVEVASLLKSLVYLGFALRP